MKKIFVIIAMTVCIVFACFLMAYAEPISRDYAKRNGPRILAINTLMCDNPLSSNDKTDITLRLDNDELAIFNAEQRKQSEIILLARMQSALEMKPFIVPDCAMLRLMKSMCLEALKNK